MKRKPTESKTESSKDSEERYPTRQEIQESLKAAAKSGLPMLGIQVSPGLHVIFSTRELPSKPQGT